MRQHGRRVRARHASYCWSRLPMERPDDVNAHHLRVEQDLRRKAETAQLLLDAARYLGETLEPERVYRRFEELLADVIPNDGVVVSSFDEREGLIRCEYGSVEGNRNDPVTLPELKVAATGGMQSEVMRTGRSLLANDVGDRAAELIVGLAAPDVRGRPAAEAVPGWEAIAEQVPVTQGDDVPRAVTLPVDVGGRELWLSFVAVRTFRGVVYAFRDQTAEHELENAKSDFIATVSHELRTPMTAVYGAARTLLRPDVELNTEDSRELLEMIATQAERLAQVTEEVLLASQLDRGGVTVDQRPVDLAEIARETARTMEPQLPKRASLDLRADGSVYATGDPDRIQQIVMNLIDNAAKYSPYGGTITVSVEANGASVRLAVADEGVGIPPAEQQAIFDKFYRVDPELTQGPGGTGLGLYISRELARRMGGEIRVTSEPAHGSTFVLELART